MGTLEDEESCELGCELVEGLVLTCHGRLGFHGSSVHGYLGTNRASEMYWNYVFQICLSESPIPMTFQAFSGNKKIGSTVHSVMCYMLAHTCRKSLGSPSSHTYHMMSTS